MTGYPKSLVEASYQAAVAQNKRDDTHGNALSRLFIEPFWTYFNRYLSTCNATLVPVHWNIYNVLVISIVDHQYNENYKYV